MKFGVREITDVVFRATTDGQKLGKLVAPKQYMPLLFLDSAKTSTLESAVATVYAQGGRGNPRLLAWDGDKTVTFTVEEALMSPTSFAAMSGAISNTSTFTYLHLTEKVEVGSVGAVTIKDITGELTKKEQADIKILKLDSSGDIRNLLTWTGTPTKSGAAGNRDHTSDINITLSPISSTATIAITAGVATVTLPGLTSVSPLEVGDSVSISGASLEALNAIQVITGISGNTFTFATTASGTVSGTILVHYAGPVLVDFYIDVNSGANSIGAQLEITAENFAGYYYVEANTLFRGQDGKDYPAQFTIPKAKIQSNFTFTMASTGDPSTFSFVMDAFPATLRFNGTKKVLFSMDIADKDSDVI